MFLRKRRRILRHADDAQTVLNRDMLPAHRDTTLRSDPSRVCRAYLTFGEPAPAGIPRGDLGLAADADACGNLTDRMVVLAASAVRRSTLARPAIV